MLVRIADKEHKVYAENHVPIWLWKVNHLCGYNCCAKRWLASFVCIFRFSLNSPQVVFSQAFTTQHVQDRDILEKKLEGLEIPIIHAGQPTTHDPPPLTPQVPSPLCFDAPVNWSWVQHTRWWVRYFGTLLYLDNMDFCRKGFAAHVFLSTPRWSGESSVPLHDLSWVEMTWLCTLHVVSFLALFRDSQHQSGFAGVVPHCQEDDGQDCPLQAPGLRMPEVIAFLY